MQSPLLQSLGMAYAANKVVYGEKLFDLITKNKVNIVLISSDMGESQKKKLINKCTFYNIEYHEDLFHSDELNKAIGKNNVRAVGLNDHNFIKLIKKHI